ncbi:MAG: chemotaxis protein CheA [Gaiellales bacterium]
MDTAEYLPMFLAECREHLQELNLSVVKLEENPSDRETIDEIFRIAHSIKGMSGAMGFVQIAELTHELENVLELVRQGVATLETEAVDVLLACLDALEGAVDAIEADGQEQLEAAPLVERLRRLIGEAGEAAAAPASASSSEVEGAEASFGPVIEIDVPDGVEHLGVVVNLSSDVQMPAVRAFQVLSALADHGDVVYSSPTSDQVDDFDGNVIVCQVVTEREIGAVHDDLAGFPDVATVVVAPMSNVAPEGEPVAGDAPAVEPVSAEPAVEAAAAEVKPTEAKATPAEGSGGHGKKSGGTTVRVDAERLDQLMHLMGELVVHRTRVESLAGAAGIEGLSQAMQDLTRSSQALQALVMQVRMIPVEAVFLRFPRLVRDLSSKLGKQVELVLSGQDTELDRTVVEALGDPLVHLVRNSLDHGLESAADREAAGKPAVGRLEIDARHAGGSVMISVRDDGRGIDPARVAKVAVERGLIAPDAVDTVDTARAIELLFMPGFSTAEVMSDVSGRGVGMDAVRTMIRELGGEVVLSSELGVGTVAQIRLPLTLAIVATLMVETGGNHFAIQLDRVERTVRLQDYPVRSAAGAKMLMLRDGVLPIIDLASAVGYESGGSSEHIVIVRSGERRLALAVDHLVGQRELVTRALPPEVAGDIKSFSGGAVLSNGEIALIVDCDALAEPGRRELAAA